MRLTDLFDKEKQNVSPFITQVYFELSSQCNLSCVTCARNSMPDLVPSHFPLELMEQALPELMQMTTLKRIVLLGFGEALCNPQVRDILALLRKLPATILLVTNATLLSRDMVDFLISLPLDELFVSWDDDMNQSISTIRKGSDATVFKKNMEYLLAIQQSTRKTRPIPGLEIVASKNNYQHIRNIINSAGDMGIRKFIVSNIQPYTEAMKEQIIYANKKEKPEINLRKILHAERRRFDITIASQSTDQHRSCSFIERGTVFISSNGDVSPCLEQAYCHSVYYHGGHRVYGPFRYGNIRDESLNDIWNKSEFAEFRKKFRGYDFPNCSNCFEPEKCFHRVEYSRDCMDNANPCGECLWAKGIIVCP